MIEAGADRLGAQRGAPRLEARSELVYVLVRPGLAGVHEEVAALDAAAREKARAQHSVKPKMSSSSSWVNEVAGTAVPTARIRGLPIANLRVGDGSAAAPSAAETEQREFFKIHGAGGRGRHVQALGVFPPRDGGSV